MPENNDFHSNYLLHKMVHKPVNQLLKTKMKSVKAKDERERYYKLLRFAVGRGFQPAEAGACLKRLLKGGDHEEFDMD